MLFINDLGYEVVLVGKDKEGGGWLLLVSWEMTQPGCGVAILVVFHCYKIAGAGAGAKKVYLFIR